MMARRLFLSLFVLLQCLGPLLHAHAGASLPVGVHLPDAAEMAISHGPGVYGETAREPLAFTVETALEARAGLPLSGKSQFACPLPPAPGAVRVSAPPWVPSAELPAEARLARHLIPLPGAPPRV